MSDMAGDYEHMRMTDSAGLLYQRDELQHLIENAEAISFDFFDTLFTRPLANPEDVFEILARHFAIPDFRVRRLAAQAEAFRRMHMVGRYEIRLEDIYECLSESDLPCGDLMRAEYELELALIEPNAELFPLFLATLRSGKPVVITSDMYLPASFFIEVLQPYGLAHIPLFISADCNSTKRDAGDLFDLVITKLGLTAGAILHIGDNKVADVVRPREKGLTAFHFQSSSERDVNKAASLSTSIAQGLLRTRAKDILKGSYRELGFLYGGPATRGFLQWIGDRARLDGIEHVLFLSRDGYALEQVAQSQSGSGLPSFCYFLGSRTAFTLSAIRADNFTQFLPFLISGADNLSTCELLERIGVQPPSPKVMDDIGLGSEIRIIPALHEKLASFMYAYRWEILKVCRRNRRALYIYLRQVGLKAGSRVALVDVGWSGTTQEAFELAVRSLMDLQVFGYYFCLADTPERLKREKTQRMSAMVNSVTASAETVASLYDNRVAVELFFSAPHNSVIGLQVGAGGIEPLLDSGRGKTDGLQLIAEEINNGIAAFAEHYDKLQKRLNLREPSLQIAWPLIEMINDHPQDAHQLLGQITNFDAWASSRNHELKLADYLPKE